MDEEDSSHSSLLLLLPPPSCPLIRLLGSSLARRRSRNLPAGMKGGAVAFVKELG